MQVVIEYLVALLQAADLDILNLPNGLLDGCFRQISVDSSQRIRENIRKEYVAIRVVGATDVGPVQMLISESLRQMIDDQLFVPFLVQWIHGRDVVQRKLRNRTRFDFGNSHCSPHKHMDSLANHLSV